ncbi:hypothetical protein FQR65_LT09964 [Abscondita terminalis]|nr:hypothetical protein FQR65_LT09964 [Abscondita terminalis]
MELNIVIISVLSLVPIEVLSEGDDYYNLLNRLKIAIGECIQDTTTDGGMRESLFKGVFTEDKNLKYFLHCLYAKLNFVNEFGVVNVDEIKNAFLPVAKDKAKVAAIIEQCSKTNEDDAFETAFDIGKCLATNNFFYLF